MADNDKYEDEYQFADPDAAGAEFSDQNPDASNSTQSIGDQSVTDKSFASKSNVIRNALIVVAVLIVMMAIYPFIHRLLSGAKNASAINPANNLNMVKKTVVQALPSPLMVSVSEPTALSEQTNIINQKISTLELGQDRMQTEFVSANTQLNGINNNINEMMAKVASLSNTMTLYATKIDEQARVIERLTALETARKKGRVLHVASNKTASPSLKYYIQAVIPGRAWLIATNGATLTVREGTMIAGMGLVTLIDPRQGRVVTSSGHAIRFSQEDS